jgi:putative flippase GtrA
VVCVGYGIDLASYVGLVELGVHLYAAFLASFVIGGSVNVYLLRRYFAAGRHSLRKDLVLTLSSSGVVIVLAMGLYAGLMSLLGVQHLIAKILSNGASFVLNYQLRRRFF